MLIPFVCCRGAVGQDFAQDFQHTIAFMETSDGNLNLNSLYLMALFVQK